MRDDIERALDEIRPTLQVDGADVELVSVEDGGVVKIRFLGRCPAPAMTLAMTVEPMIKERVPAVRSVVVTP